MNNDFVAEILRATGSLRSADPAGVTAIIQNALAAAGLTGSVGDGPSGNPKPAIHEPDTLPGGVEYGNVHFPPRIARMRKPLGEVVRTLERVEKGWGSKE